MAVVPAEDALEVEATVLNKDIGFVRVGQEVNVKMRKFSVYGFGYLTGKVLSVSHECRGKTKKWA